MARSVVARRAGALVMMVASACGSAGRDSVPVPGVAAQPAQALVVSPSEGPPFVVVTVSGGSCSGSSPSVAGELEHPDGDSLPGGTGAIAGARDALFFTATPDATGAWTGTFTVPPVVAPGSYRVVAGCSPETGAPPVAYAPQPFEVLAGDSASMAVSPREAPAGVDVVLDVTGTLCRGAAAEVDVQVLLAGSEEADEPVARAVFTPDGNGTWAGQITIPAGPAATYIVGVVCTVEGRPFFIYLPATGPGEIPSARLVEIAGGLPPTR